MASNPESDLHKLEDPPTQKKIDQWIKDGIDLVFLIGNGEIRDAVGVRQYLDLSSNPIDKRNDTGQTPLMVACRNRKKDVVTLLLDAGADPNLTCTVNGSTALHYACEGEGSVMLRCREEPSYPQDELRVIIDIVKVLASHGAVLQVNDKGLSPVYIAALNRFKDVVDFFTSSNMLTVPISVKVKAYELLGASQAVFDKHHTMDACKSFHLAASFHSSEDSDVTSCHVTSDLDAWFVNLMDKKNPSDSEMSKVKMKALSIAVKSLPNKALDNFWNDSISLAVDDLFNGKAIEKGYELFAALIKAEMKHESLSGSVMEILDEKGTSTLYRDSPKLHMPFIPKLLEGYADAYRISNTQPPYKSIEHMGNMIFNIAYYLSESKYLVECLPFIGHIVNMKRKDVSGNDGDERKSVLYVFFERMAEDMWEDVYSWQSKQTRNRLKFTICRLLHYNGLDRDLDKSLLETLLEVAPVARDRDFIVSVAQVLIRYGCPTEDGCLVLGDIEDDDQELSELFEPTKPIPLEELAARAILNNRIPYREMLPDVLCEKIEGEKLFPDSSDLDSSTESDNDSEFLRHWSEIHTDILMASESENDCQEVGDPPCQKEKIDQWVKDGVDLVSLMHEGKVSNADDVRQYLALSNNPACVDKPNGVGQTPLMIACRNRQKDIVNLLLEAGADPNLTCTYYGCTALHYACEGEKNLIKRCREEPNYPQYELSDIIEIVEALGNQGAILKMNDKGLSPVCVAALNSFKDVVDYFASSSVISMPVDVKVKAFELLGVSQAVFDKHHTMDACKSFHLAASFHSSEDSNVTPCHVTPDLDAWFVNLMDKENPSDDDMFVVKAKAIVIGLHCLSNETRNEHDFYDTLAEYGQLALFEGKASQEGYEMLRDHIHGEMTDEYTTIGTVMEMIRDALEPALCTRSGESSMLKYIIKLLDTYAEEVDADSSAQLDVWEVVEVLGNVMFGFTYYHSQTKYLESSFPSVVRVFNCLKKIATVYHAGMEKSILSVFMDKLAQTMWEDMYCGQSNETKKRLKYTICRLLHYIGFDPDTDSFLLDTFLQVFRVAYDTEWILSIAHVLIRYGCDTSCVTLVDVDEDDEDMPVLQELLSPSTSPPTLEELSARALLCYGIPYRERLPDILCEKIEGEKLHPDRSELFLANRVNRNIFVFPLSCSQTLSFEQYSRRIKTWDIHIHFLLRFLRPLSDIVILMASVIESGCAEDGNCRIDEWIKDGVDLVHLIEHRQCNVDGVRRYLDSSGDPSCVNRCNHLGQTPLMVACKYRQKDIVNLLLEAGADPNLTCTVSGSTALHYACQGEENLIQKCREEPNFPQFALEDVVEIVTELCNQGAVLKMNDEGLSPVCVAALNSFKDVVDYFVSSSVVSTPVDVKVKAYELLGVSQAVFDKHHTMDACKSFHLAASFHSSENSDVTPCHVTSDLDAWFVNLMDKENPSDSERFEVKAKAFIFGMQSLPHKTRDRHDFYREMSECARSALFKGKAPQDGYEMLLNLIHREMSDDYPLGSVMDMIQHALAPRLRPLPRIFKYVNKLLDAYANAFTADTCSTQLKIRKWDIVQSLGELMFNYSYYYSSKYLESSFPAVATIVNCIKQISAEDLVGDGGKVSILESFINKLAEAMWEDIYCGQSKETRNRLKFTICRLLHFTGFDPDIDPSLLDTFLQVVRVAYDTEWILAVSCVLIRYGCSTGVVTLDEGIDEDDPEVQVLLSLLSPPTTPVPLEELASRLILRTRIPYRERLPDVLCEKIEGEKLTPDPSQMYSSPEFDAD
ncbi:uncharacterized protein LOC129276386 [Lytechinus pictus]|uniref:uncharacterized protein LOC129276386 n=1 Tax=Lytechinus pictus TaxID=7653 RepID=UPI0030B9E161